MCLQTIHLETFYRLAIHRGLITRERVNWLRRLFAGRMFIAGPITRKNWLCGSWPVVYSCRLNFIWITVLYRSHRAKTAKILQFPPNYLSLLPTSHTHLGLIWHETVDPWCTPMCQICESVYCAVFYPDISWGGTLPQ